jgi:hypothetical protein
MIHEFLEYKPVANQYVKTESECYKNKLSCNKVCSFRLIVQVVGRLAALKHQNLMMLPVSLWLSSLAAKEEIPSNALHIPSCLLWRRKSSSGWWSASPAACVVCSAPQSPQTPAAAAARWQKEPRQRPRRSSGPRAALRLQTQI